MFRGDIGWLMEKDAFLCHELYAKMRGQMLKPKVGIMLGAGMIPLAVFSFVIMGVVMLYMANRKGVEEDVYILVLQCAHEEAEKKTSLILEQNVKQFSLKSKTISAVGIEWTVEVRIQEGTTQFINQLYAVEGVHSATLVSYNGEYMA